MSISYFTSRGADNDTFFTGNKSSKWYLVSFGMIGASLSGITFISVPGWVDGQGFAYMQMVIGYVLGYAVVAFVLIPMYYRMNLTSIYTYLETRFGSRTHLTGALFFILSRVLGASVRLFLVADVLYFFVFREMGVPFEITVLITLALIYVYTYRGGIKTIVWTDTLQTAFILLALGASVYLIYQNIDPGCVADNFQYYGVMDWFVTDNGNSNLFWWKHILGGMFVTIAMTGLDQDMMQKNLTCKNEKEAKKNIVVFTVVLFFVNIVFLGLGVLLYTYMYDNPDLTIEFFGMEASKRADRLFPLIALKSNLGIGLGITFLLGLIAAAYSSADSALTSLTTSVSIDILKIDKWKDKAKAHKKRMQIHIFMTVLLFIVILLANVFKEENVIGTLFKMATYTYGPLLGLFFFGILTKRIVNDKTAWIVCIIVPLLLYVMKSYEVELFGGYQFGYELLGINGLLCFLGLYLVSKKGELNPTL